MSERIILATITDGDRQYTLDSNRKWKSSGGAVSDEWLQSLFGPEKWTGPQYGFNGDIAMAATNCRDFFDGSVLKLNLLVPPDDGKEVVY